MKKKITKLLFYIYDLLSQRQLSNKYKEIKKLHNGDTNLDKELVEKYLKGWGLYPELTKNSVMNKTDVLRLVQKVDSSDVHNWAYTGGSYGEPLRVPYSKKRAIIRTATFRYFNEEAGYSLGDSFALIRAKDKSPFKKFLRNETIIIPMDVSESKISEIIEMLKKNEVSFLMGYPTVMYDLAIFLNKYPDRKEELKVNSLLSASEMLEDEKRQFIYDVFGCSFVDRYANEEVGMIAQQKEFGGEYYTNKYGVITEVVDPETLQPVQEGEKGKVLVTDIYNDLIPIVRYDTGDLAVAGRYENGRLVTIKKVIGREIEKIFDTKGNSVSSLALGPLIYKPLSREGQVMQFQLAQISKIEYILRIKGKEEQIHDSLQKELLSGLKKHLGSKAEIIIKPMANIPPQPSGKRPVYKNEIGK
ncbi:MAG: AMP-binding protein [Balneolaceae bacterium]